MTLALVILGALAIGALAGGMLFLTRRRGERELAAERAAAITRQELRKITVELKADTTPLELAMSRVGLAIQYQRLAMLRMARAIADFGGGRDS